MESSAYTDRTLALFDDRLYPAYKDNVGIVLQSYLYRTSSDVERAVQLEVPRAPVQGRVQGAGVGRVSRQERSRPELREVHARC